MVNAESTADSRTGAYRKSVNEHELMRSTCNAGSSHYNQPDNPFHAFDATTVTSSQLTNMNIGNTSSRPPVHGRPDLQALQTSFSPELNYDAVSKLPTPLVAQNAFVYPKILDSSGPNSPSQPRPSSSNRPDRLVSNRVASSPMMMLSLDNDTEYQNNQYHTNYANYPTYNDSGDSMNNINETADLLRSGSLRLPKRNQKEQLGTSLYRSGSVGSPQRKPTTVLHREPGLGPISEQPPEEVFLALDPQGRQSAWEKIQVFGKGSFSEVILARPAKDYLNPERAEEIEAQIQYELEEMNSTNQSDSAFTPSMLVAIKVTTLTKKDHDTQMRLFNRDLDILSTLPRHPCIVSMLGFSVDQEIYKRVFFVLPLFCGGDLFDMVSQNRSKMSLHLIRRIFADVCSATVFLHKHNIVHRDIKLENVLLALKKSTLLKFGPDICQYQGPIAVLTDLGLARKIDPENPVLTTRCGSDDYVPPEIIIGQPYDGRETDSWALGVLLYAMMEGRLPFDPPPHSRSEGARQGLKTAHRIARLDWAWYKRKDCPEFDGGKEIVENCLKRRGQRMMAWDTYKLPWVSTARPAKVSEVQTPTSIFDLFM